MRNTAVVWALIGTVAGMPLEAKAFYLSSYTAYSLTFSRPLETLPSGFVTINVGDETFYYSNGIFYQKIIRDQKYAVAPAPVGAVVFRIPKGYQYVMMDGKAYYMYKGVYYKRVLEGYKVIYPPLIRPDFY